MNFDMKRELELFAGWAIAAIAWFASHFNAIVGGLIGVVALCVWCLKLRREWKHRNDKPEND